jgi:mono/diheme cytochrome c family protein
MKKLISLITIVFLGTCMLYSCQYKKEDVTYPQPAICDTSNVRYSVEVKNILQANCYSCHAAAVANSLGSGNVLDNYNSVKQFGQFGLLLNNILWTPGYNRMPKNAAKLSDCNIAIIRTWIRNGMPNN